jgi:hypothetical protein
MGFKVPTFQDRAGSAAEAKRKALEQLKNKPPVDEQVLAERQAARLAREAAEAEKRAAKKAAKEEAEAAKLAAKAEAEAAVAAAAAAKAAAVPVKPAGPTEEERKAARDARYAARKKKRK